MIIKKIYIEYLLLKDDEKSLNEVLVIIQPKLLAFALGILKVKPLAEDVVQESMIAIIKGVRKLKNHRKFHAWIYQITRNKCFDMIRKNHKYKDDSGLESLSKVAADDSNNDNQLDMISKIKQLPHKQKTVIHLFYYAGFSIIEIAEILQKPAGTVKSLLFDARENLKQLFGE